MNIGARKLAYCIHRSSFVKKPSYEETIPEIITITVLFFQSFSSAKDQTMYVSIFKKYSEEKTIILKTILSKGIHKSKLKSTQDFCSIMQMHQSVVNKYMHTINQIGLFFCIFGETTKHSRHECPILLRYTNI